jgi:hypothetical protein
MRFDLIHARRSDDENCEQSHQTQESESITGWYRSIPSYQWAGRADDYSVRNEVAQTTPFYICGRSLLCKWPSSVILARPPWQTRRESFAKECLCRGDAAIRPKQKNDRLAVFVDSPIEITKLVQCLYRFRPHARKYSPAVRSGAS